LKKSNDLAFAITLVITCSIIGTIAQFAFKNAAIYSNSNKEWYSIFMNPYLVCGYLLYGVNLFLLTIALKKAELSFIYPFIGLTYVWVSIFSPLLFPSEKFVFVRLVGVFLIVIGISFIGIGGKNEQ